MSGVAFAALLLRGFPEHGALRGFDLHREGRLWRVIVDVDLRSAVDRELGTTGSVYLDSDRDLGHLLLGRNLAGVFHPREERLLDPSDVGRFRFRPNADRKLRSHCALQGNSEIRKDFRSTRP
jgi:hypothetical protein